MTKITEILLRELQNPILSIHYFILISEGLFHIGQIVNLEQPTFFSLM